MIADPGAPAAPAATAGCLCGRTAAKGKFASWSDCCGPVLEGQLNAPDAERLMRSRYSAFVLRRTDYLLASWHASTRPASLALEEKARWLGLEVRAHRITGTDAAEVEFVARFRLDGRAVRQHERSRFVREDGRWYYLDGDVI